MQLDLQKSFEILDRTPQVLEQLLSGLSEEWLRNNEGPDTWSPYDIVGHLIHGEKTDWIERTERILDASKSNTFEPFDRFAQFNEDQHKTIDALLTEFSVIRSKNLAQIKKLNIATEDLDKKGIHPSLGEVSLKNLLATWVAHDLGHIAQITRVMAKQYKEAVGPWQEYLSVMHR